MDRSITLGCRNRSGFPWISYHSARCRGFAKRCCIHALGHLLSFGDICFSFAPECDPSKGMSLKAAEFAVEFASSASERFNRWRGGGERSTVAISLGLAVAALAAGGYFMFLKGAIQAYFYWLLLWQFCSFPLPSISHFSLFPTSSFSISLEQNDTPSSSDDDSSNLQVEKKNPSNILVLLITLLYKLPFCHSPPSCATPPFPRWLSSSGSRRGRPSFPDTRWTRGRWCC